MTDIFAQSPTDPTFREKFSAISWSLITFLALIAGIGVAMLYSAADGSMEPWALRHATRFAIGFGIMLVVAFIDIRIWMRLAWPIYSIALLLLLLVEFGGDIGMGAQRWIDFGVLQMQPSEIMKIALVLVLARYFHGLSTDEVLKWRSLIVPLVLLAVPAVLVVRQPDLGTTLLMLFTGVGILFLAGVHRWVFGITIGLGLASIPLVWQFLEAYQRQRILTFFRPETDPLGSGYQIIQSKIALGSGGVWGRGYMEGTQSHLNFLPEQQTDFIFTMLAEEFGLMGGIWLLLLYMIVLVYALVISLRIRHTFGQLVVQGVALIFFFYVFTNIAMVMGLVPVVGVPLPLVSWGGTAMVSILFGFGLLLSADIHRDVEVARRYSLI